MSTLPALKPVEVIRKLRKAGFFFDRHAKGSHEIWFNPTTGRRTVIRKDIPKGTLRAIVREAGLTIENFNRL